jgi:hypothetical protein
MKWIVLTRIRTFPIFPFIHDVERACETNFADYDGSRGLFSCFQLSRKTKLFAASSHCLAKALVPRFHIYPRPVYVDAEAVCPPFYWRKNEGNFAERFHRIPVNETWLLCEDSWSLVSGDSEAVCPPFFWRENEGNFTERFHRIPMNETWLLCEDSWLLVIPFWWMEY